jgi:hypothetical protein
MNTEKEAPMLDDILKEADALVHGQRNTAYGHPIDDYSRVVDIFKNLSGIQLSPEDGALFMVAVKLARLRHNYEAGIIHRDSLVDAAGYLWVFAQIVESRGRTIR